MMVKCSVRCRQQNDNVDVNDDDDDEDERKKNSKIFEKLEFVVCVSARNFHLIFDFFVCVFIYDRR